jgi:glycosyltransferase involved in cell wall biosynthesis
MLNLGFSATNPCHLYEIARAVEGAGKSVVFYSGYPSWKLAKPLPTKLHTDSFRTCVVYGLLRLPERFRPKSRSLFRWQDRAFDRWVAKKLAPHDFVHAMPGQCIQTFKSAKEKGCRTVLNHATGPSKNWIKVMEREYQRVGRNLVKETIFNEEYLRQEAEEYALADLHCAASSIVRRQLIGIGIAPEKIWVVPYGASPELFFRATRKAFDRFRILFAGQLNLRKDIRTLLRALEILSEPTWEMNFYGQRTSEAEKDLSEYKGATPLRFHGAVSRSALAAAMREASVLVLPSLEEGFGLVVPQALSAGTPCIVSDRVGAQDLLTHRENGSIFPVGESTALADELSYWSTKDLVVEGDYSWKAPAQKLVALSQNLKAGLLQPVGIN